MVAPGVAAILVTLVCAGATLVAQSGALSAAPRPTALQTALQMATATTLQTSTKAVTRHMPRTVRAFTIPTQIQFSKDPTSGLTTLEISTADRPGLLARIGSVLSRHGVTVQGAKIQTLGERVEDIFFLSDDAGHSLEDESLLAQLEAELIDEVGAQKQTESQTLEHSL